MRASAILLVLLAVRSTSAAAQLAPEASSDPTTHPQEVAWVDEGKLGSVYRETAHSLRLYIYDVDPPGQSACLEGCASAWPPVLAPANAIPVGDWTIVSRKDGSRQWAYRGKPVYTRYHDAPSVPTGDDIDHVWHLLPYSKAP